MVGLSYGQADYSEDLTNVRPTYTVSEEKEKTDAAQKSFDYPKKHQNRQIDSLGKELSISYSKYKYAEGYRIQIYQGKDEVEAEKAEDQAKELEDFKDISIYLTYNSPNFRVKVGDYTDRVEAYKAYIALKEIFPNALLVQENQVELYPVRR